MAEHVTCTFSNRKNATIIIEKQTDPANYPKSFDFSGEIVATLADNQTAQKSVTPGTYTVTEAPATFWDVYALTCDDANSTGDVQLRRATFRVESGETVKCTFFNRKRGDITIVKQTNPAGAAQTFSFNASYDADGFSLSDGQSNWSGALVPGTYSVSEVVPAGWALESATCDDGSSVNAIQLAPTEDIVCTFVNTKKGSIVVEKQTLPNGDPEVFAFSAGYDADGFSLSDGQSNDSGLLAPGTYSVSENVPAGWDLDSAVCSISRRRARSRSRRVRS